MTMYPPPVVSQVVISRIATRSHPQTRTYDAAAASRIAATIGVTPAFLVGAVKACGNEGVDAADVVSALHGFGAAMHAGKFGTDLEVTQAMQLLKLQYPEPARDGSVDFGPALIALAARIADFKDPYTQEHITELFGVTSILPVLRLGPDVVSLFEPYGRAALGEAGATKRTGTDP